MTTQRMCNPPARPASAVDRAIGAVQLGPRQGPQLLRSSVDPADTLRVARLELGRRSRLTRDELAREVGAALVGGAHPTERSSE